MEPYIQLLNTDVDVEKKQFIDKIEYDGYHFSVIVSANNIDKTLSDMDYLFQVPTVSQTPNIANMNYWEFIFYDNRGRECRVEKEGEYIYLMLPRYNIIKTDVSSGIAYLRIFYDTLKHLADEVYRPLNTAQIISDEY
jgi:hypothetical protein